MIEIGVDLGVVTAPSGVLVLGMAGWIDHWARVGPPLSERAAAAPGGGGHLHEPAGGRPQEWLCEAVAVPAAADRPLRVRAAASPSPFDGGPTIAVLETDLGLPWPPTAADGRPVLLGDLPVDRCGMVLGDASALDSFTGEHGESSDGLADVAYWGKHAEAVYAKFGGDRVTGHSGDATHGWPDVPVAKAEALAETIRAWARHVTGADGLTVVVDLHTHAHRLHRAGRAHPLLAGVVEVAGCPVLGLGWDSGDHSMRHRGERRSGHVYPVTLEASPGGGTVLRWTIPPYEPPQPDS
ncbi:hypothetical protein ACFYT4_03165 [Streptomyces sp. NPDC004609]|uniref:hypothetical protein n=1 Tax=Streptomyces sp. NPDC004609 TaxID=3364704 RepID=UPI0036BA3E77